MVTCRLTREDLAESVSDRTEGFRPDPELPVAATSEHRHYAKSDYYRGHMAPAANFKRSAEAMSETFLLSNIARHLPDC